MLVCSRDKFLHPLPGGLGDVDGSIGTHREIVTELEASGAEAGT